MPNDPIVLAVAAAMLALSGFIAACAYLALRKVVRGLDEAVKIIASLSNDAAAPIASNRSRLDDELL